MGRRSPRSFDASTRMETGNGAPRASPARVAAAAHAASTIPASVFIGGSLKVELVDVLLRERERLAQQDVVPGDGHLAEPAGVQRLRPRLERPRAEVVGGADRQV